MTLSAFTADVAALHHRIIEVADVLHPTKEGQFPRDPIFFGQTPHP